MSPLPFPPGAFRRVDERDDAAFYASARRVVHIDADAVATLTLWYEALVPVRGCVLDLMASWRSHLPPSFRGTLIGLGMNRAEMVDNPQLRQALVHDLNADPRLPFADAAFDAVICAVSVQYLTRPVEVFREVHRTLRSGASFIVSFSNRCFPEKAVALWRAATDEQHLSVVAAYFAASTETGCQWSEPSARAHTPVGGDPLFAVWAEKAA